MLWYDYQLLTPHHPSDARGPPHTPSLHPSPHHPARSPFATSGALRSLSSSFQVSEAGGSQLHLRKLDGILMALPVEPVNALQRQRWHVEGHTRTSAAVKPSLLSFRITGWFLTWEQRHSKEEGLWEAQSAQPNPHTVPRPSPFTASLSRQEERFVSHVENYSCSLHTWGIPLEIHTKAADI